MCCFWAGEIWYANIFNSVTLFCESWDNSVGIVTDCGLDDQGSNPGGSWEFFTVTLSKPALGPTQPPIQWIPGALSLGVKWLGHGADHSPPSGVEVKECMELYLHSQMCLHGVVLS
jgi:hypothetical protein